MLISEYFSKLVTLSAEEKAKIEDFFIPLEVKKGEMLLKAEEICEKEFFVNEGCLKSHYTDTQGQEVVLSFAIENWWAGDIESFHQKIPSKMCIEALENSILQTISLEEKNRLLVEIPQLERAYRIIVQRHLQSYQERLYSVFTLSAQERYEFFMKKYPKIALRVPQYSIASFLGISPESLSRIRKKRIS